MNKSARLKDKVAVVTGAGAKGGVGTGAAMALTFAREGARVVVLNRSAEAADATVALIRDEGGECVRVLGDVTSAADCARAAQETVAAYGAVDVLVNNAANSQADSIVDGSEAAWEAIMGAKLKGAAQMSRAFIPHVVRGGAIINISSIAALRPPRPPHNYLSYSTANGGLITMTSVMAVELGARGIRINCVIPGQVWTPIAQRAQSEGRSDADIAAAREQRRANTLLNLEGTAWDIANAVLFFASDDARWITGQSLVVDGGFLC